MKGCWAITRSGVTWKNKKSYLEISQVTSKCQNWQVRKVKNELDTIEFFIFELVKVTNFNLNWQVWCFGWSNFSKNGIFGWKEKSQLHFWILLIWISLDTKFQLKLTILIFWTKFTHGVFLEKKTEKVNINTEIWISKLIWISNYSLNWQFCFFSPDQICPKRVFLVKSRESEHHHWILHIWISLGIKFHLKQTILNFVSKFVLKGSPGQKTEKVKITTEFCIFKLV